MQSIRNVTIGFIGKRRLPDSQKEHLSQKIKVALQMIREHEEKLHGRIQVTGISPLAIGGDTLFAEAILELGHDLKAYLPFEYNEYFKDFKTTAEQQQFERLYNGITNDANKKIIAGGMGELRHMGYLEAGKAVVNDSDYVIALWDETPGLPGGTGDTVKYLLGGNEALLWQKRPSAKPKQLLIINYAATPVLLTCAALPADLVSPVSGCMPVFLYEKTAEHDLRSGRLKWRYNFIWKLCSWLGLFAAVAFSAQVSLAFSTQTGSSADQLLLTALESGFILAILLIIRIFKPKKLHSQYLLNRFITEQIRILKRYFWSGIHLPEDISSPILRQINRHHARRMETLEAIKTSLRQRPAVSDPAFFRKEPIMDLVEEQIRYHGRRLGRNKKRIRWYTNAFRCILSLFTVFLLLHFITVLFENLEHRQLICLEGLPETILESLREHTGIVIFITMFLTAALAKAEAIKVFRDWEKLALQSEAMKEYFDVQKKKLAAADNDQLPEILDDINRQMFYENLDWQIAMLDKETTM